MNNNSVDVESAQKDADKIFHFNDISIRQAFIRKVYALLLMQMLITIGITALIMHLTTKDEVQQFFMTNKNASIFLAAGICTLIVLIIVMICCPCIRRKHPINLIFLFLFTSCMAALVGFACLAVERESVYIAGGLTAAIVFGLTLFTFQTKYDVTGCASYLGLFILIFLLASLLAVFYQDRVSSIAISALGVLLFSFILVFDTKRILGSGELKLSPEEYVFAALTLYMDILNIFLRILKILQYFR